MPAKETGQPDSNTSHVTLYRRQSLPGMCICRNSNTSHVTLYRYLPVVMRLPVRIQIHLMLLFIYSHLPYSASTKYIQIHLMLLFIQMSIWLYMYHRSFKYISCYSLSDGKVDGNKEKNKFKYISCYSLSTSYGTPEPALPPFKYISCYSLSMERCPQKIRLLAFKYISCYSLSSFYHSAWCSRLAFKYISCYSLSAYTALLIRPLSDSNTSHVTLYLFVCHALYIPHSFKYISCYSLSEQTIRACLEFALFKYISCYSLSKDGTAYVYICAKFKYISCYSLSPSGPRVYFAFANSNTSHVTLYRAALRSLHALSNIQIHLMLLFIISQIPICCM